MTKAKTEPSSNTPEGDRIAKVMARAGLCSRREAEGWITAGRVFVNGQKITSPALNVTAADRITIDGKPLRRPERTRLFLYHKPRGLVTTHADPEGRPTIFEKLPEALPRLVSVGRLDLNTEGLLLLTNDGGLARVLELPETAWLRRYRVRAHGSVTQPQLDALRKGVTVKGVHYGAIEATMDRSQGANVWLTFAIREGKNREVRNVLEHLGLKVNRLIRISFGPFQLGDLPEGEVEEVRTRHLREQLGERIAGQAGADFAGPVNVIRPESDDEERSAKKSSRHSEMHAGQPRDSRKPEGPLRSRSARDDARPARKENSRKQPPTAERGRAAPATSRKRDTGKAFTKDAQGRNAKPARSAAKSGRLDRRDDKGGPARGSFAGKSRRPERSKPR